MEIINKPDIVLIAERYTRLRPSGKGLTGLCPIHNERTPSFFVYPDTQRFKCFGCNAGGDVIDFIKEVEGQDFTGALRHLGIEPVRPARPTSLRERKKTLLAEVKNLHLEALYREVLRRHSYLAANWLRTYNRHIALRYDFWQDDAELVAEHLPELLKQCETAVEAKHVKWWVDHALQCRHELFIIREGTQAEQIIALYRQIIGVTA